MEVGRPMRESAPAEAHPNRRRRLLRLREVAEYLGLSLDTVHRMCRDGRLPYVRIGRRIRIEPEELARWVAQHRCGYDPPALR
jgi:excisionase family DNA binding protein